MKFRKSGRAATAAVFSLGCAAAIVACGGPNGTNNTIDYVYVANSKQNPGQINVYYADSQSGALTQIKDSPYPSGGSDPVALVTSPNFKDLYVVNNGTGGSDSNIVQFTIGSDAKLYPQHTYQPPQTLTQPNAVAINTAGTLLFVTYKYLPGFSSTNPGPGGLVVFPINTDGSLGTAVANGNFSYFPLSNGVGGVLNPTAVNSVTQNPVNSTGAQPSFVYVVGQNATTGLGSITAFSVGTGGALTAVPCANAASICNTLGDGTFNAGTSPNAIASTPRGLFLYVTDGVNNQLISYTIQSTGQIVPSPNGPTRTDVLPDSVVVDPRGMYIYVANFTGNDISAYTINTATGYPTGISAAGTYGTGTGPTCVFVEPALGRYVYTTNFLDNTVTGFNLNPNTGSLAVVQNNPFPASGQPTCIAATPHGNHPTSTPTT